ncbi:MAG: apolipoprotein N-acyltransferase, partial [Parachlamydiaceae bacterium]
VAGLAIFWGSTLNLGARRRFWLSLFFMAGCQMVQLYWFVSHPYLYIYVLWTFLALLIGLSFAIITAQVTRKNLNSFIRILGIASLATLFEWARLFLLSGFSWNPIGLSLSANPYSLQMASLFGIYGLSFWVYLTNLLLVRAYLYSSWISYGVIAVFPFIFGAWQIKHHDQKIGMENPETIDALLVQTAFPVEEILPFKTRDAYRDFVIEEWESIFKSLSQFKEEKVQLIVLPEYVVPFGTYTPVYPEDKIKNLFNQHFGGRVQFQFPYREESPFSNKVSNADIIQTLADYFQADVIAGLEDVEIKSKDDIDYFSSAFFFESGKPGSERRYDKRVLVPMGEYIPFKFCRDLAKSYGIQGSFTCGNEAKVFQGCNAPFGLSICYEETYADLMRENRAKGAKYLVNLTSDVWYPDSDLPRQHLDHARLRTVECGYPLLRSCNTGITTAIDSLGRTIDELEGEWTKGALKVKVPLYNYSTLYTSTGDALLMSFCFMFSGLYFLLRKFEMH